jgi:hypothetical protein
MIYKNKIGLLVFAWIMMFGHVTVLGQGIYGKKTTPAVTTTTTAPNTYGGTGGMLRANGTDNSEGEDGDGGNLNKIEALEESAPLDDGLYLLVVMGLGYGMFIWKREQKKNVKRKRTI